MKSEIKKISRHRLIGVQRWKKIKKSAWLYALLFLPVIYYIVFHYAPMYGVLMAFKDYKISKGVWGSPWVGFKWFEKFLFDPYFWKLVRNTLLISLYGLLWGFWVPIVLALMLNEVRHPKFKKALQTVSYLPHFISTVVICGMVVNFCSLDGLFNQILEFFGKEPIQFLIRPEWFRTIYTGSGIWQSCGWTSIIYLSALTSVDPTLLDAAEIDGASRFQKIRHVLLPLLKPTISVMLIMQIGRMMSVGYEKVLLLYNGNTYETADIISSYVYRRGILGADHSYSTAVGLFTMVIGLILLTASNAISKKLNDTSLW